MNSCTSYTAVCRRRYAQQKRTCAREGRTATEKEKRTRRSHIHLDAAAAGAGAGGEQGVDTDGMLHDERYTSIDAHLQRTLEAAAYTQAGVLRASSLHIPDSICASCYRGKVQDTYTLRDGRLLMVATDRASAFDRHVGYIPFKGAFLTATSKYWMDIARESTGIAYQTV